MVKIYLDPGHGGSDPGAQGNGLQEKNLNLTIATQIRNMLVNEYEDVVVRMSRSNDRTISLAQRTNDANSWGADYYLSIHINAGGGSGFESYIYPNIGAPTTTYQNRIHEEVLNEVTFQDRGRKRANFHVLRETTMHALLTENGFIDNGSDASKLRSSAFLRSIARGHVNGIVSAFQLKRKNRDNGSGKLYRVQIGAFSKRNNANTIARQARAQRFQTYIFEQNGLYKVQIGAFSDRENAEELATRAKAAGFDAYINYS